jgi:hypothetical protein
MTQPPFRRDEHLEKPGIVGARWWHEGLKQADKGSRRTALKALLFVGVAAAIVPLVAIAECGKPGASGAAGGDDFKTDTRVALDMQKEYGWSFGATTEPLTFDGQSTQPFDRSQLKRMADDLRPGSSRLPPYYVPTLFQSPGATPRSVPSGDTTPPTPLADEVRPISTPAMDTAYRAGKALAALFDKRAVPAAVVVDLPGPEAVAFAAGAAHVFEPVFAFDNWPHPRGVVPAHLTLAAAAFYQPLFARTVLERPVKAPAMFVLDRARLAPYTDEKTQFDNRHLARLPTAANLTALGVKHVLYVVPKDGDVRESDDLNDDLVFYKASSIDVKAVGVSAFGPDPAEPALPDAGHFPDGGARPNDGPAYYYGRSAKSNEAFWLDYPWTTPLRGATSPTDVSPAGKQFDPAPRATAFSSGSPTGAAVKPRPASFGTVPIIVAVGTGVILGAALSRNGSWNRSSGSWGGG